MPPIIRIILKTDAFIRQAASCYWLTMRRFDPQKLKKGGLIRIKKKKGLAKNKFAQEETRHFSLEFVFYNLRGHEWHFLIETMPEVSGASSRWVRSVSDDTTGRHIPCRGASSFFLDPMTGRCRFAQPPATCFDASGIILIRDVSFLTATSITSSF